MAECETDIISYGLSYLIVFLCIYIVFIVYLYKYIYSNYATSIGEAELYLNELLAAYSTADVLDRWPLYIVMSCDLDL